MEVTVRIIRSNPWSGIIKWPTCYDYIGSYWTRTGNIYTGLDKETQTRLEEELGYEPGKLSSTSSFWDTFAVKVGRDGITLDTKIPEDELKYLFLKNHKRVADGLNKITASTDYVLINKDSEAEESNKRNKVKREAYKAMDKMSLEDMRKCLRVFGIKSDTISNELVENKVSDIIENQPQDFINRWVKNPDKELNFIVEAAIAKNVIRKNRTQYFFGTDMIGNGIDDCIAYLKDKKNADILTVILNEVNSK